MTTLVTSMYLSMHDFYQCNLISWFLPGFLLHTTKNERICWAGLLITIELYHAILHAIINGLVQFIRLKLGLYDFSVSWSAVVVNTYSLRSTHTSSKNYLSNPPSMK